MSRTARVAVLGGGIAGLSAAWRLAKRLEPSSIVLLEASRRLGGWIESTKTSDGGVFEHGPRSLRLAGNAGRASLSLVEELGLGDDVLPVLPSNKGARKRLIYGDGRMNELGGGLAGMFRRSALFSEPLARAMMRELVRKNAPACEDETVHQFCERRLGNEIAHWLADPLCRGIFAGSSKHLSMRSCFPKVYEYERRYGSVIRGAVMSKKERLRYKNSELVKRSKKEAWVTWSLRNGLESLPNRLGHALSARGVKILKNKPCTSLEINNNEIKVHMKGEDSAVRVDSVVSAIPARNLSSALMANHPTLASHLERISAVTVAIVLLEFDGKVLPTEAFGYLVPSHQPSNALGVVFDSCSFPEHDRTGSPSTRLTVMMGGHWFNDLFGGAHSLTEDRIEAIARETIADHLGIQAKPTRCLVRILKDCIPQYNIGHHETIGAIDQYIEEHSLPLTLVGASYRAVAVNDIVDTTMQAVDQLCNKRMESWSC